MLFVVFSSHGIVLCVALGMAGSSGAEGGCIQTGPLIAGVSRSDDLRHADVTCAREPDDKYTIISTPLASVASLPQASKIDRRQSEPPPPPPLLPPLRNSLPSTSSASSVLAPSTQPPSFVQGSL
mmetsp:Transcript_36145/g.59852  ORF Transcript_36145/g.59852 Transcript_36145/m.59852 type:complete len:125 (+) Transcript_36145:204-578(+)